MLAVEAVASTGPPPAPQELAEVKAKIVYKAGTFNKKIWDRWHGNASKEDLRATNVHIDMYRVRDGYLQRRVIGNGADHTYADFSKF